jgi:hypothetical protein
MSALPAYWISDVHAEFLPDKLQERGLEVIMIQDCLQRNQKDRYREWKLTAKGEKNPLVMWWIWPLDENVGVLTVGPCPPETLFKVLNEVLLELGAERLGGR